jgi:hypothetical protein
VEVAGNNDLVGEFWQDDKPFIDRGNGSPLSPAPRQTLAPVLELHRDPNEAFVI